MIFVIDDSHFKVQQFDAEGGRQALPVEERKQGFSVGCPPSALLFCLDFINDQSISNISAYARVIRSLNEVQSGQPASEGLLHLPLWALFQPGQHGSGGHGPLLPQVGQGEARGYGAALEDAKPVW